MTARLTSKSKGEISYPHEVKRHGVAVKVYKIEKPSRGTVYVVTYYRGGVRLRDSFRDEAKALRHAETPSKLWPAGTGMQASVSGQYHSAENSTEIHEKSKSWITRFVNRLPKGAQLIQLFCI